MEQPLGESLIRVAKLLEKSAAQYLEDTQSTLTYARYYLLSVLEHVEPTTQHRLATILEYSDAAISRMLAQLVADDYVLLAVDPTHGRKHLVQITDKGHRVLRDVAAALENALLLDLSTIGINANTYHKDTLKLGDYLRSDIIGKTKKVR